MSTDGILPAMRVYGLTGNFGSGKSTVADMFRRAGIPVLDADRISREIMVPGNPVHSAVVSEFGPGVLLPDGSIDREALSRIVFSDPGRRADLEAITHPAILEKMRESLAALSREGHRAALVEAALIHESGRKGLFEAVVSVRCDREVQLQRVMSRDGISRERALSRLEAQMDAESKAARSDHRIDNSGSPEETLRQVERIAEILLRG